MQSTVQVTQKMGTLFDANRQGAAHLESFIKTTALPVDSFDLSLALNETFMFGLVAERRLLLSLIKSTELCLKLLIRSMHLRSYSMFVTLITLLPGDENQKKTLINDELKKDDYADVILYIDYQRPDVLKPRNSASDLMEELFEKYLTPDDLKNLATMAKMTHERLEIICQNGSKKVVQMLFSHMPLKKKITLIKAEQFLLVRCASMNPHSHDLPLFLLQELNGLISEEHRNELVKTVLSVSSQNNRVGVFKTTLAAETSCADKKNSQLKLYEHVSRDNFSLFIAASDAIQDAIIDMFSENSIKQKLLIASIRWKLYFYGILKVEYNSARRDLLDILRSDLANMSQGDRVNEEAIAAVSEVKEALIKHIKENNKPVFSKNEKKFIRFIRDNFVCKLEPQENSILYDFFNTKIILINPANWAELETKFFLPVIQQIRLLAKEEITENIPLAELHKYNLELTRFFAKHSEGGDYQYVRTRLPRLSFIEMEQDIRKLFAPPLSPQSALMKERIIWADSLDVSLESKTTAKTLYINGDTVHKELANHLPESGAMSTTNLIVAQMGFVVSHGKKYSGQTKLPSPGRGYVSFPVKPATEVMYVTEESGTAWNETTFYRGLERDIKKVNGLLGTNETINHNKFDVAYKHSEQALFQYIESPKGIQYILNELKKLNITAGHKIYAVVLDIRSTQQMCAHCKTRTIGVQNSQADGFLFQLTAALKRENVHVSKRGLMMVTRVSAVEAFEKAKDYKDIRGATPDFDANVALTVVPPKPLHTIMNEAGAQKIRNLAHKMRVGMGTAINDNKEFFAKFASGQTVGKANKEKMKSGYKATQPLAKLPDIKQLKGMHLIETPKQVNAVIYSTNAKQTGMYTIFSSGSKKATASSSSSSANASAAAAAAQPKKVNVSKLSNVSASAATAAAQPKKVNVPKLSNASASAATAAAQPKKVNVPKLSNASASAATAAVASAPAAAQPAPKLSENSLLSKKRNRDGALKAEAAAAASTAAGVVFAKK